MHHHTTPSAPLLEKKHSVVGEHTSIFEPPDVAGLHSNVFGSLEVPMLIGHRTQLPNMANTQKILETSWLFFRCGVVDGFEYAVPAL